MLEPWVIDEIRRREEDSRRGDRPRLEIPAPGSQWPSESGPGTEHDEWGDKPPERGVAIMGM
jgi:hypothetical protein